MAQLNKKCVRKDTLLMTTSRCHAPVVTPPLLPLPLQDATPNHQSCLALINLRRAWRPHRINEVTLRSTSRRVITVIDVRTWVYRLSM